MLPTIGNATLCGDRRGRGAKTRGLIAFFDMPARPSAEIGVVEVQKRGFFGVFCGARATLCGDRRGRGAKTQVFCVFFAVPARPSSEIGVVEVQTLEVFCAFCGARATLCGDRACRSALAVAPCEFFKVSANPPRRSCVSKRSRCGAVRFCCSRNGLWKLSRGLRACFRNPAVAGSISPWSAAAPA